jgi:hypothetical protein
LYVFDVCPEIFPQDEPSGSHRRHWYENDVGLPLQLPLFAVSVLPTMNVPSMVGGVVFWGAAASAPAATTPASTSRRATSPISFLM